MKRFVYLILIWSIPVWAQEPEPAPIDIVIEEPTSSRDFRKLSTGTAMLGYQIISSWIPFKWSAGYTHIFNPDWSLELEYSRGKFGFGWFGFDLAKVTEQRWSLLGRRYVGNSFHFILGAFKNDFHAQLGSRIVDDIDTSTVKDFRVQAIGASVGIGNRWQWKSGFSFGIDWLRINVPLMDKKVDSDVLDKIDDKNDLSVVRDAIDKVKSTPTFVLFGLQLGYTF